MHDSRNNHYVPQFYLRNFAVDPERKKITTVGKNGRFAVWKIRSIKELGYERDLYVSFRRGVPVSREETINSRIETPISESDTWAKIASGRTDTLDQSDKPILYALIRHFEVRTPHYHASMGRLARLAVSENSPIPFTEYERGYYARSLANPELAKSRLDQMAASLDWTEEEYAGCGISIWRSPITLRSSTIPVMVLPTPAHPALRLPLPGMVPFQRVLPLNKTTVASLVVGNFADGFENQEIDVEVARIVNLRCVGLFAYFDEEVRHLITDRGDDLVADMTWAPYELVEDTPRRMSFRRRTEAARTGEPPSS